MLILGLDPGTAIIGYAILEKNKNKLTAKEYGCIRTNSCDKMGDRLVCIESELKKIIKLWKPEEAAVEKLFFLNNVKTAMTVSQARGVILLALSKLKIPTFEYTPLHVKLTVAGYGKASKLQIQKMVKSILGLSELPQPDDAADSLAIAICHAQNAWINNLAANSNKSNI